MVSSYLRHVSDAVFGVIVSSDACFVTASDSVSVSKPGAPSHPSSSSSSPLLIACGALEYIAIWDTRKGTLITKLKDGEEFKGEVTTLVSSRSNQSVLAAGYSDGSIKLWNVKQKKCIVTLNGHKGAVTALQFNESGSLLVSGSADTNVIVWDVVNESGLYKLRGHKDMVTDCIFLENKNKLITSSKDSLVKIWDLETQHCIQTIASHRNEVWSMDVNRSQTRLITGSSDNRIRVWSLDTNEFAHLKQNNSSVQSEESTEDGEAEVQAVFYGMMERQSKERVGRIRFSPSGELLACQAADNSIELFTMATSQDIKAKLKKRKTKLKKKMAEEGKENETIQELHATVSDELSLREILHVSNKIKSFSFSSTGNEIAVTLVNNQLEVYNTKSSPLSKSASLELPGHRSDISYDDKLLLTTSKNSIKIWSIDNQQCLKTISSGFGLCGMFIPGNKHVIIGTKSGTLEIYDLAAAVCTEIIQAHEGSIWSMDLRPDKTGLITGSADKSVKFWDFELVHDENSTASKRLTISLTRTLSMSDDVLCVKYSPDNKLIAIALLDSTVKVFHEESLKFFLSLYGHKLPVMSLSISSDSTLIVTASADKNVKIWGLDFGDCHRSLFAHEATITSVKFVPKTHYFWTSSKDKLLKYWDADKFEQIQILAGHQASVWGLAVSSDGSFVVSVSQDRSIRSWIRTDEQLFLDEEREKALEASMLEQDERRDNDVSESARASKRTEETIKASERLMEAIEVANQSAKEMEAYIQESTEAQKLLSKIEKAPPVLPPQPNPIMLGLSPSAYVFKALRDIKASELEESLLVLPYSVASQLLVCINQWMQEVQQTELLCRCLFFLLKIHHNQITADKSLVAVLDSLRTNTRAKIQQAKDVVGFNRSALHFVKRNIEQNTNSFFFEESIAKRPKKAKQFE